MKYIYHHLGLGDHIICNGLVRTLIKDNFEYSMFVKPHNLISVSFMYRDLKNLNFIEADDAQARQFIFDKKITKNEMILAGFHTHPGSKSFDESFYLQNGLSFEKRWDNFYVERDFENENKLFEQLGLEEFNYIFVHDDKTRGYEIDETIFNLENLKVVRPSKDLTNNIFDYCKIIEKSRESHFIDSSFRLMTDSFGLKEDKIFYHINMKNNKKRNYEDWNNSTSKLNFKII